MVTPALKLIDSVGGDIDNVSTKLHSIDAAIAAGNAGSAAASALVQQNLTAYETSNNGALATLSATVTSNRAVSDANHVHDAAARTSLETALLTAVSDEEAARQAADATLTTSLATEITNRTNAVSAEASTRAAADTALTNALAVETARIDNILLGASVDLDQFTELVSAFEAADTTTLATIATMQTQLTALQATVDALTDGN